jgi:hypothetical protein
MLAIGGGRQAARPGRAADQWAAPVMLCEGRDPGNAPPPRGQGRESDFAELVADSDVTDEIDLATLGPLIGRPIPPAAWCRSGRSREPRPARSSSTSPRPARLSDRDGDGRRRQTRHAVSFADLTQAGSTFESIAVGARIYQAGCVGCIEMGEAPTTTRRAPSRAGPVRKMTWPAVCAGSLYRFKTHRTASGLGFHGVGYAAW